MEYRYVSLDEVRRLPEQLATLSNAAFAEYEGAPEVDAEFVSWYLRRPGSGPAVCVGALWGDELVACVLVALQALNLGGEFVRCGIIDTVATHPAHRRRGLARRLMELAHGRIGENAGEAAVLYTNPENHPYLFYGRLGYVTRARAALLTGVRPGKAQQYTVRTMGPAEQDVVRELVNGRYGNYEGFALLDEALWDWHRLHRPSGLPVTVAVAERGGEIVGTAALAVCEVLLGGQRRRLCFASDLVYPDLGCLQDLLALAPASDLAALYDTRAAQSADLQALGFESQLGEVSMVLPFTSRTEVLLRRDAGPWYVMVESVVGV
ncbi:MAG: GNAT family N-acetyltransferase [Armatimonadetes bacterium]|nr:GNAT family N-acetyltransferase [Armatimonadota bacterium]